jgi:acetyltransferase-like isoleucine patch superfamily enzyme
MIDKTAKIGEGTILGHGVVIEKNVMIGKNCKIGNYVVIHADTHIGDSVRIDDHSVLGKLPMRAKMSAITELKQLPPLIISNEVIIGSHVVIYRGANIDIGVLIADFSSVREEVEIGSYSIIGRGVTVENKVRIGKKVKIETEAYITALSEIEDYCFISPEVTFTNDNFMGRTKERFKYHKGVTLKRGARVGANSTILPGVVIHEDGVVAAGSIVTKDVPARMIVLGVPARVWKAVPKEQLLENQDYFED